jgi:peptide/nickel transport system permease protein
MAKPIPQPVIDPSEHKPPFYYVKKRFFANKPAVAGLITLIISVLIAILGYLIVPDPTPDANDGAEEIQKNGPGFKVKVLKTRKNEDIPKRNFLWKMLFGQESAFVSIEPIESYRIEGYDVYYKIYNSSGGEKAAPLADVVLPLFVGDSKKLGSTKESFKIENDKVVYLDFNENIKEISREQLIKDFEKYNIETRHYYFGTDHEGRDMLSRLILGVRISLGIGFVSVIISILLGVSLGATAGFFRGRIDAFITWFMTVVWSIPGVMLVIAISLALGTRGAWVAFIAVGLTTWVEIARIVRGAIMELREKQYIEAARAIGMSNFRIIYVHALPNILGPLIVEATANFASAILLEAGLSFLGLSVGPPTPSWGTMVSDGKSFITDYPYLVFFPSICISILVLALNLLGNGLRDAYDPRTAIVK